MKLFQAGHEWLGSVGASRTRKTYETYRCAYNNFLLCIKVRGDEDAVEVSQLTEHHILDFIEYLHQFTVATERLYVTAIRQFYKFLIADNLCTFNMETVDQHIHTRARRQHVKLPEFPEAEIERLIVWVEKQMTIPQESGRARLRALRDRALILTLADTGLRINEACRLKRGNINWSEGYATVVGKNGDEDVVHFTKRSRYALKKYLDERAPLDGASGRELVLQPIFARHDLAAGSKVSAMTTTTGRRIMEDLVASAVGHVDGLTPHKLRHFFITTVYNSSNDLHETMVLARHKNIGITVHYTHRKNAKIRKTYDRAMKDR